MVEVIRGEFNDMDCLWLSNGLVRLAVTTDRGPRIVFWGWQDGANLLAELPDAVLPTPNGPLHLLGGHRLWYAPEVVETTYWPDSEPVALTETPDGASFTAPPDGVGIAKTMALSLASDSSEMTITHTLRNSGGEPRELAPWAISMCRMGGVALLPQPQAPVDPGGLWPNRWFRFWPYSNINDPRLALGNHMCLVHVTPGPSNKFGYHNTHGWFAYLLDDTLFSKRFDKGTDVEFYFSDTSIELESLGKLISLAPETTIRHTEIWRLHLASSTVQTEDDAIALATTLGL